MKKLYTIGEMSQILNAKFEKINSKSLVSGFSIDSRTINAGELFFCIKGQNTDGHNYIPQALQKGACAVVADPVCIPETIRQSSFPQILVPDPNMALMEWAADMRKCYKGEVLAVTGSNGKTTTKEILAGLCRYIDPNAYATPGNFNNFIGVPLTLLEATPDAKWWVIEIGTNQFGEVAELSKVVQPTAGIITNIGQSHLEFLQNTVGVAREKSGLFAGMLPGKKVIVPDSLLHLDLVEKEAEKSGINIIKTSVVSEKSTYVNHKILLYDEWFESSIDSPISLQNLVLALTLLKEEGVPVPLLKKATASLELSVKGRFQQIVMDDWILIDDTYNANPSSFYRVLEDLKESYPEFRKIVVCGAMAELGDLGPELHRKVGENMVKNGVEKFFGLGGAEIKFYLEGWKKAGGKADAIQHFRDIDDLIQNFLEELRQADVVLVKGSRSAKMERFVEAML